MGMKKPHQSRVAVHKFVVDDPVQGVFEVARHQLPAKIDGEKPRAGADYLVASHASVRLLHPVFDIPSLDFHATDLT